VATGPITLASDRIAAAASAAALPIAAVHAWTFPWTLTPLMPVPSAAVADRPEVLQPTEDGRLGACPTAAWLAAWSHRVMIRVSGRRRCCTRLAAFSAIGLSRKTPGLSARDSAGATTATQGSDQDRDEQAEEDAASKRRIRRNALRSFAAGVTRRIARGPSG
jgi:hypothetical protein